MKKLLIIDDDESWQTSLGMLFRLKGYTVLTASNGTDGIQLARTELPDLILSDVNMPGPDGLEALAILRSDPVTSHIPVILMTGEEESLMRRAMELGADDFLTKPVPLKDLLKAVEARLRKQQILQQFAEQQLADLRTHFSLALPEELTGPLNKIRTHSEVLESCAAEMSPPQIAQTARGIHANARAVETLIRNFLLHARLETIEHDGREISGFRSKLTPDLAQLLRQAARSIGERHDRLADVRLELAAGRAEIGQDFLVKMVEELLDNAFAASAPGTPVRLTSREVGNFVVLEFCDQGCGMSPAQMQVLAPFVRHRKDRPGLGLGLAIVRKLAALHGGLLNIKSATAQGTTITVTLPARLQQIRS